MPVTSSNNREAVGAYQRLVTPSGVASGPGKRHMRSPGGRLNKKLTELYEHLERFDSRDTSSGLPLLWLLKPAAEWVDLLNREKSQ